MDIEKIYRAFPQKLRNEVQAVISVLPLEDNILLIDGMKHEMSTLVHADVQEVRLEGETLYIPTRVYFNEPNLLEENALNELQKAILHCLYLKHHDGYIRQKRLNSLPYKNHYFSIPYAFQLLGEYVEEILNDMDGFIDESNIHLFRRFLVENRAYSLLTKSRIVSYWNEYYRVGENRNLNDYIGRSIFNRLENS